METLTRNQARALKDRSTPKGFLTALVTVAKQRAARRGLDCTITRDYLFDLYQLQEGACALSGTPMTTIAGQGRQRTNISVDRIDSSLGYVPGNVQLVCDYVNTAKGDLSQAEFLDMCRKVAR